MKKKKRGSSLLDNTLNSESNSSPKAERLQAFLAHCGVASRRASEKIILDGRVKVNGSVVTELGTKVTEKDEVLLDGKKITLEEVKRYVLLNKPLGYVCSQSDEKGRPVAVDLLREKYTERLYNVGRLDMFSFGAIIFTNDGDFAAKLSHPSAEIEKEYIVDSSLPLPRHLAEDFERGIRVEGVFYKAKRVEEINSHRLRVVLIEGKNREIRRVFESFGIAIKKLCRVRIGTVQLGDLEPGDCRNLTEQEVHSLLALCKPRA
ncbi:MAG: rRNA pseudouridine synthase [Treponema sp.]|nr:rRNA pseudouridine synthase [Treponema sp.]